MNETINSENLITHDDFLSTSRRCHYNQFIGKFYERFADDHRVPMQLRAGGEIVYGKDPNFVRRGKRVQDCCKTWTFDYYQKSKYKNLVRVDRCDDRFCLNCQALKADQRFVQYAPLFDEFLETNDMYHIVFTVPNVEAWRLRDTVTLMLDKFAYLIRFFQGSKRINGVNFDKFGYEGAVRSLEITVSKKDGTFHPHLHTIFVLKKDMDLPQVFWNKFSVDSTGRTPTRLMSELDMLMQRIWCLLILKEKVTADNILNIGKVTGYSDGFSCRADLSNGKYHEIFKYAIKGSFKNETLFDYENFLTLYDALYGRRCYQTYGCLSKFDFNEVDEELGLNSQDKAFDLFLKKLQWCEVPKRVEDLLGEILNESANGDIKFISRATFARHFKALSEEDKEAYLEELQDSLYGEDE